MKPEYPAPPVLEPSTVTSLDDVLGFLEQSTEELGWPTYVAILSCSDSLEAILRRWGTRYESTKLEASPLVLALRVPRRSPSEADTQWFLMDHSPGVAVLMSNEHRDLIRTPVRRWVQRYQPLIAPMLLNTPAMRRILDGVSRLPGVHAKVMLSQVSVRSKLPAPTPRKFLESSHTWTDRAFDEVFDELRENRRWATNVRFRFGYADPPDGSARQVEGSVGRNGEFTSAGWLSGLFRTVISVAASEARHERDFFQQRGVEDSPSGHFRPLVVQYDEPVFADRSQNRLLIRVLESMPNVGVSVLHPNPYLRAAVVDYVDGSTYDVWVVRNDRITIVPKTRATGASLERLCAQVCSEFRDGDIRDYQEELAEDLEDNG